MKRGFVGAGFKINNFMLPNRFGFLFTLIFVLIFTLTFLIQPVSAVDNLTGYYVATNGSAGGNGNIDDPWDLDTALGKSTNLIGTRLLAVSDGNGSTINATIVWVRNGTYGETNETLNELKEPTLQGNFTHPVILRTYPGERAKLDMGFHTINSPHLWFWGLEVTSNQSNITNATGEVHGFDLRNNGQRVIHSLVHNHVGNGIGWWNNVDNHSELYGNLIYNNGRDESNNARAHGIYFQSSDPDTRRAKHNFIFHNFGHNLHGFGSGGMQGQSWIENVMIGYGVSGIGGIGWVFKATPVGDLLIEGMMGYSGNSSTEPSGLGQVGSDGGEFAARLTFVNAYMRAASWTLSRWENATITNNTLINLNQPRVVENETGANPNWAFNSNTYFSTTGVQAQPFRFDDASGTNTYNFTGWKAFSGYDLNSTFTSNSDGHPSTNKIFTFASDYEPKTNNLSRFMGIVVAYNWENLTNVSVDVSNMLNNGDSYKVVHVFDFYGSNITNGTYNGNNVSIPMTAVAPPEPSTGWPSDNISDPGGAHTPPPTPGPEFGTFIIVRTSVNTEADITSPTVTLNSPANTLNTSSTGITFNATASDDINLTNVTLYSNFTGTWAANETNSSGVNNSNYIFSKTLAEGRYIWNIQACDNSSNCVFALSNRTLTVDLTSPKWQNNQTNSTLVGTSVNHSINWTDNFDLANYTFSFDNGTGTFVNDSVVVFTGIQSFSNVVKVVNSSVGSTIRWRVYANDTAGNENVTSIFSYTTTEEAAPADGGGGSGGGGSGGGGGAPTTGTNETNKTQEVPTNTEVHKIQEIYTENTTIIKNVTIDVGIKQIQIEVNNKNSNVTLNISKYDARPSAVSLEKEGIVYRYLQIETNIQDLRKASITSKVEQSWISENNVNRESIVLSRFDEGSSVWEDFSKINEEEDSEFYYYGSEITSFSFFAISGLAVEEEGEKADRLGLAFWILVAVVTVIVVLLIVWWRKRGQGFG